jgi:hypothetical protein
MSLGIDAVARGFHLHEYTYVELDRLFKDVGFTRTRALIRVRGRQFEAPTWLVATFERAITALPGRLRHRVAQPSGSPPTARRHAHRHPGLIYERSERNIDGVSRAGSGDHREGRFVGPVALTVHGEVRTRMKSPASASR